MDVNIIAWLFVSEDILISADIKVEKPEKEEEKEEEAKINESVLVQLKEDKPKEDQPGAKSLDKKEAHPEGKNI